MLHDFFISYTRADDAWGKWIAWVLEADPRRYKVFFPGDDIGPGQNIVLAIQKALNEAEQCLLVLSAHTEFQELTDTVWSTYFTNDPNAAKQRLLPVRVEAIEAPGLLKPIKCIDLFDLDETACVKALRDGVTWKPDQSRPKAPFPGNANGPAFPGSRLRAMPRTLLTTSTTAHQSAASPCDALHIAALLDKRDQAGHVKRYLNEASTAGARCFRYLMVGKAEEWPEAVRHKVAALLGNESDIAEMIPLSYEFLTGEERADSVLRQALAAKLHCEASEPAVRSALSTGRPKVFFRPLDPAEMDDPNWVQSLLTAWRSLVQSIGPEAPAQVLIFVGELYESPGRLQRLLDRWRGGHQRSVDPEKLRKALADDLKQQIWMPDLVSPQKGEIGPWVTNQFSDKPDELRSTFKTKVEQLFGNSTIKPHGDLREGVVSLIREHFPN